MKSMTTKLMITAAALAIATGVASAEQYRADIPFAFRAGGKVLAPGSYMVKVNDGQRSLVSITNRETLQAIMVLSTAANDHAKSPTGDSNPVLTFLCGTSRCSLSQIWTGPASPALMFAPPRLGKDDSASATVVRKVKLNGD